MSSITHHVNIKYAYIFAGATPVMMVSVLVFSERPGYMLLLQEHDQQKKLVQETRTKNLTMKRKRGKMKLA